MEFFLMLFDQHALKKYGIEIGNFSFQICFWNHFWTLGRGQTEKAPIEPIGPIDHFPSKIDSKS